MRWHSHALRRRMTFLLHLPYADDGQTARRYPVLYLLHGSGHDPHSVLEQVRPQEHLTELGAALLVIPAGDQGWWFDSPAMPRSCYASYLLELVAWIDRHYPTVARRGGRGVCGFSMGGFGAMLLAGQHPDQFGAASSILGPLDIAQMFPHYYRLRLLLGADLATWQRYNPTHLAARLAHTALWFCSAEEAFDRPQSAAFAAALRTRDIPFEYALHPGQHDAHFVREHIGSCFAFHCRAFDLAMQS